MLIPLDGDRSIWLSYVWCGQGVGLRWSLQRRSTGFEADPGTGLRVGAGGLRVDKA